MISSKKVLKFYIMADCMMNRGYFKPTFMQRMKNILNPDYIIQYLEYMRKVAYYSHRGGILSYIYRRRFERLGIKLGFSIGPNVFGYGLVIPHWGTIVVGDSNRCGNYCVLHTSTCISDNGKKIGDALYLSTGVVITKKLNLGNNISIAANSVVNKSFMENNLLICGVPAFKKNIKSAWYNSDDSKYKHRIVLIEEKYNEYFG